MTFAPSLRRALFPLLIFFAGLGVGSLGSKLKSLEKGVSGSFIELNENAPILSVQGKNFSLLDLSAHDRHQLNIKVNELVDLANSSAKRAATLALSEKKSRWSEALASQLTSQSIVSEYSRQAGFKDAGRLEEVTWDIQSYILNKQSELRTAQWFESLDRQKDVVRHSFTHLPVTINFEPAKMPSIAINASQEKSQDLTIAYQYSGRMLPHQVSEVNRYAQINKTAISLQLLSQYTGHPFDQRATEVLLCAEKLKLSNEKLLALNNHLMSVAPASVWASKMGNSLTDLNLGLPDIDDRLLTCQLTDEQKAELRQKAGALFELTQSRSPVFVYGRTVVPSFTDFWYSAFMVSSALD